ncbi:ABC transporter substrate-binding protein [Clostridium sp. MCC353]|uniref:ABC transporter substrate-binding protein n=1 Tax=Clostridium sp. MCC353 TaxID=2592646 RepID=UPI001C0359F3|nr:ABC transporter substrate-binding protein [Clostridium sp. MCC353]
MKKQMMLSFMMSMALIVTAGCSSSVPKESEKDKNISPTSQDASKDTKEENSGNPGGNKGAKKIKIAYHPHVVGVGGLLNAIDNGYFEEENLEVELVQFTSGATELAAMASGDIDIGYLGVGAHVFAPQGQCSIIALDSTDLSGEILVRADSGYQNMTDLMGKNVGISAGTTSELVLSMALKLNNMKKTDVNMINMDASGKVTAFMTGQIDAISIEVPYTDQIRKDMGNENVITISGSKDFLPEAVFTNSWVTTNKFLEKNEDVVVRFLKAWLRGTDERNNNMEKTVQKVADYINTDYDVAFMVTEKTNWISIEDMKKLEEDGTMLSWYQTMNDMFLDAGLLDQQYDIAPEEYVKLQYLKQALDEIGVD